MTRDQKPLQILYIGPDAGTCRARFDALLRIGHDAQLVDPFCALGTIDLARSWSFKTGGLGLAWVVERYLAAHIGDRQYDLAYVDSGELIGPGAVRRLRRHAKRVVNYNPDNPYSTRDSRRWRLFLKALPEYDLVFVPRLANIAEALEKGARDAQRVWFAADDHLKNSSRLPPMAARLRFRSPVSFVGTWMPERGSMLTALMDRGLPLRIFGPRWDRAPELEQLAPHLVNGELDTDDYHAAVAAADISIALLSKGNRDEHTTRSLEIPALGSLLCGERTSEHLALYKDGEEAVFWSTADECAALCHSLFADPPRLKAIADAGRLRAIRNDNFNEPLLRFMLARAMGSEGVDRTIERTLVA